MPTVTESLASFTERWLGHVSESNELFWEAKMALGESAEESHRKLAASELAYQAFYEDPSWLRMLSGLKAQSTSDEVTRIIDAWQRAFEATVIEDDEARAFSRKLLEHARASSSSMT